MSDYVIKDGVLEVALNGDSDVDYLENLFGTIARDPEFHCDLPQLWLVKPDSINLQVVLVKLW